MAAEQAVTLIQVGDLTIRRMRDDPHDYRLMAMWLSDERVLEFYEGRDQPHPYGRVVHKYRPRVRGDDPVRPSILVYQEVETGYLQYYLVTSPADCGLADATDTHGIDMFIGEPEYWDRGIGSRALSALARYLFDELNARKIVIDPHVDNLRAVRAYEKAGFRKVKILAKHELHEGAYRDSWLMTLEPEVL